MTIVGITGAYGFLGWHLRCRLRAARPDIKQRPAGRELFTSPRALDEFVSSCDKIIHLAGANRAPDQEIEDTNIGLATMLAQAIERTKSRPSLIFSNSIQGGSESPYGRSKRKASLILSQSQSRSEAQYVDVILPNLFGEHGRPFYNSVVATFCHQLTRGDLVKVNAAGVAPFLHVQEAAQQLIEAIGTSQSAEVRCEGTTVPIPKLYEKLQSFNESYRAQYFPELKSRFDTQLFNTLRSYRFPDSYPVPLELHSDVRGLFVELSRGYGENQVSFSRTEPKVSRGDHYHLEKVERFVVLAGEAVIKVRRMFNERVHSFALTGDEPCAIDMPTLHTHKIDNVGSGQLMTAFWANDHFNPHAPDTFPEFVEGASAP